MELGASTFRGTYLLPPVLHVFSRRYPGVTVNIHEANSMALEQMLQAGEVDIGLIALPLTRLSSQPELLMRDEICIIAAPDHPVLSKARIEKGRSYVDPRDLGEFEFILSDGTQFWDIVGGILFRKRAFPPPCTTIISPLPLPPPWLVRGWGWLSPIAPAGREIPMRFICPLARRESFWSWR